MLSKAIGWTAFAIAAGIIVFQVLVPPPIGLADNRDFDKVSLQFDLRPPFDPSVEPRDYFNLRYQRTTENPWVSEFHSSEVLLAQAAVWLNSLFLRNGEFDIRALGAVHAALFLLAFGCFVPLLRGLRPALQIGLATLAIVLFCDVTYSMYYNTFYMDAGAFVFLMLTLGFFARALWRENSKSVDAWLAVLFAALMLTAKSQHALLAIPLLVLVFWKGRVMWPRRTLISSALAAILVAGASAYSLIEGTPPGYANPCLYNMIFGRILPTADDPAGELASLGLDNSYLQYMGTDNYASDSPMHDDAWAEEFMRKTSFGDLAAFYITHPLRAMDVAQMALEDASTLRPPDLGNYDKSAGRRPNAKSHAFALWSTAKRAALWPVPGLYPLLFAIAVGIIIWRIPAGGIALALMGGLEFGLSGMTDAAEVTRHLFFFNLVWDLTLFGAACVLIVALDGRLRRRAPALEPAQEHS